MGVQHGNCVWRMEVGGFCIFQWEFGLQEPLLSCPGGQMAEQRWEGDVGWVCGAHLGDCPGWTLLCSSEVKISAEE